MPPSSQIHSYISWDSSNYRVRKMKTRVDCRQAPPSDTLFLVLSPTLTVTLSDKTRTFPSVHVVNEVLDAKKLAHV